MNETVSYIISFVYAAVLAGTPLLYGTLGEILTEKSGNRPFLPSIVLLGRNWYHSSWAEAPPWIDEYWL